MSHRDESLSTRDLASTSAEDTGRTTDRPEEPGAEHRDEAVTDAAQPGDERVETGDTQAEASSVSGETGETPAETGDTSATSADAGATTDDTGATTTDTGEAAEARGEERPGKAAEERGDEDAALLPDELATEFQGRWESIQTTFVDDPRDAVEKADALVAELMQRLADGFARERERLEGQWSRGEDVSTEDLRVALQRYRSFFRRLLSA